MRKFMFRLAAVSLLSGATAFAGSFTSDFSNPNQPGYTLNQGTDLSGRSFPVVTNSELLLLYNEASLGPISIVLNDLDAGMPIDTFSASFQLQIGPATSTPADGIAFVFGPDVTSTTVFNEQGPYMPSGGIAVCFVTYAGDGPGIGVNVRVAGDGTQLGGIVPGGYVPMASSTMVDSQMHNVTIQVKRNGMFSMVWNGQVVFTNLFLPNWTPVNGQFAIGGRTGGLSQQVLINDLVITTTPQPASPAAPTITGQPQNVTVNEGASASFAVGFDGEAPLSFQWTKNSNPITDATGSALTLTQVSYADNNAQIACTVSSAWGSATSHAATMTVIRDTTPPTVTKVAADFTYTNVWVTFSQPVSDTALVASNYKLNQGVTVAAVTRVNPSEVALETSPMPQGATLTLTINGVQDMAATPNTIAPNTQVTFKSFVFLNGSILHKVYFNCSPDSFSLANLFADPRYPNSPDRVDLATSWEWPPNSAGTDPNDPNKSMFYESMEGYFIPPTTGDYVFYMCGDDEFYMFLSTDESPANMAEVAAEPGGWSDNRAWNTPHSGTVANWNSATYAGTLWPNGNTVTLTQGKSYYLILFHHDHSWSGGDWSGATFSGPNVAAPVDGDPTKLTGSVIGFNFDPTGSTLTFTQEPQSVSATEGTFAHFTAAAAGDSVYGTNVLYQWQSAPSGSSTWANVAGATTSSLVTHAVVLADNGTQYRVIATMAPLTATSTVATLTVTADTTPPVLSAGAIMDPTAGTVDIGIGFNESVDDVSGSLPSNYSVSSGTITSFTWATNRFTADSQNPLVMVRKQSALLKVTGFSGSGTVTVKNVKDTYGNQITTTNIPVTVASNLTWGVVGANQLGGWNAAVPVGPGAFDVYSDGFAEWGTYDETTFIYEQVTGDFDKKLRVQYQDGSSEWARAGIIARDVLNLGVDQATQTGSGSTAPPYDGTAGRYQKCHVNPVGPCLTGPGAAANASWEGNRRLDTGGASSSCLTNVNATPLYPNAWCRLQRRGQTFSIFRSADGVNWELLGQTVWGQDDQTHTTMPQLMYVGPEYSPENGNVTVVADQGTFLAQFRDYGDYSAITQPTLSVTRNANGTFTLNYTGTLYSSATVKGTYAPVAGASNPFTVNPKATGAAPAAFYRAEQ
jgi:Immunoglobulin I-set domain